MNKKHDLSLPLISEGLRLCTKKLYAPVTADECHLQETDVFAAHFQWNKTSSNRKRRARIRFSLGRGSGNTMLLPDESELL